MSHSSAAAGGYAEFKFTNHSGLSKRCPASVSDITACLFFDIVCYFSILQENRIPWLPKLGLQFQLPNEFQQVEWFGRGPQENTIPAGKPGISWASPGASVSLVPYNPSPFAAKAPLRQTGTAFLDEMCK